MRAPETIKQRATRLQFQTWVSEKNRQVKLAARPDAETRKIAAEAKRAARRAKRTDKYVIAYGAPILGYWKQP